MQSTSRRMFFKSIFDNVHENIQKTSVSSFLKDQNNNQKGNKDLNTKNKNEWVVLGTISDFPPGTNTEVNEGKFTLISNYEGLYVIQKEKFIKGEKEPRLLIKLGERGTIYMKENQHIPKGSLLSIMTGEFITEENL